MSRFIPMLLVATLATPALAINISNLDKVPHRIAYDIAGSHHEVEIAPGDTAHFNGEPNGTLSLLTSPHPSEGGVVNSDGILSGYIGNGRDQNIAVDDDMNDYAIWPGGKLMLQRRIKQYGGDR